MRVRASGGKSATLWVLARQAAVHLGARRTYRSSIGITRASCSGPWAARALRCIPPSAPPHALLHATASRGQMHPHPLPAPLPSRSSPRPRLGFRPFESSPAGAPAQAGSPYWPTVTPLHPSGPRPRSLTWPCPPSATCTPTAAATNHKQLPAPTVSPPSPSPA